MTLWLADSDLEDVLRRHEAYGVVSIRAGDLRAEGLGITRSALVGNLNHCEVFGQRSQKAKRRLRDRARWVKYFDGYPAHLMGLLDRRED
jgi:hypothetical protein